MKKFIFLIAIAMLASLNASADQKQVITFAQLPQAAQDAISKNFNTTNISYVMKENGRSVEYEVRFNNGTEVEFDADGALKEVDCKNATVPDALIPSDVLTYVKTTFPAATITEWGRDDNGYEAKLNNGLKLEFDSSYRFLRIDN
jgi:hypothetical protein